MKPIVLDIPLVTDGLPRETVTVAHCASDGGILRRMTMYAIPGHTKRSSLIRTAAVAMYGREAHGLGGFWIADGTWDYATGLRVGP